MAPFSRTSSPVKLDPDHKPENPLSSPIRIENSMDCHPWDSRGRRLFPQHRPSIPTSVSGNANAISDFPPFESPPQHQACTDHKEFDSSPSSPSFTESVATVEVRISPTPNRLFPEADPGLGEDARTRTKCQAESLPRSYSIKSPMSPSKSSDKGLKTSFSVPMYMDALARGNLRWKSMAQFHKSRHRVRPTILSQLPNSQQVPLDLDKFHDPLALTSDAFRRVSPIGTLPYHWSQSPKVTAHPRLSAIEVNQDLDREENAFVVTKDRSGLDVPELENVAWDCTVTLSTVATVADNGKLHVHHLALVSVIMPMEDFYAEKVSLSFIVANALRTNQKCSLAQGQSSLLFKEDFAQSGFFPREGAELIIVRNSCDLEKPLNLYFAFTYPSPWHFVMASLPTLRPKEGRSLSEVVFIAEPRPPLSMRTYTRDPLSSWKLCHHPVNQVTCYERLQLPRLYPAGFQDDIQIRILELDPVRFPALGELSLSGVIWKLDVTVHELPMGQEDCRMTFFVEVGADSVLVSLIPHDWVPQYFIIDGCVATERAEECWWCWRNKEGRIKIFKRAQMRPGPIMVETYWQRPPKNGNEDFYCSGNLDLPSVADRKMLGGRLTCRADKINLLNHLGERICSYGPVNGTSVLLPTMDAGYRILFQHVTDAHAHNTCYPAAVPPPFLPIPNDTQSLEDTIRNTDIEINRRHGTGWSHTVNNVKEKAVPQNMLLQQFLLPLIILLFLVPGFLRSVEHVRKGNNHNELTNWSDGDPFSRNGEVFQAIIDVVRSDTPQPAVAAVADPADVTKCEGWRDWIDYESGWKGCIPRA